MIGVDMSNLAFSTASTLKEYSRDILRHVLLTRLANLKLKLKKYDDGPMVLAFDSRKGYWRKLLNEYYKSQRAKEKEASSFDWEAFFTDYDVIIKEFQENLSFICLMVDGAEGDDILAVLSKWRNPNRNMVLCSTDTDLFQLRKYGVEQYSIRDKVGFLDNSQYDLFEHIVKGDRGDGIPNILSPADSFYRGVRQVTMTKKIYETMLLDKDNPVMFCKNADMLDRYTMNKKMIDLDEIPENIVNAILDAYDNYVVPKGKLFNYCVEHKLTKFLKSGGFK